jgi:hypothetical protein
MLETEFCLNEPSGEAPLRLVPFRPRSPCPPQIAPADWLARSMGFLVVHSCSCIFGADQAEQGLLASETLPRAEAAAID